MKKINTNLFLLVYMVIMPMKYWYIHGDIYYCVIYSLKFTDVYYYRELEWLYFHDESVWAMCCLNLLTAFPESFLWKNKIRLLGEEELLFSLFSPHAHWLSDYKWFFPSVLGENTKVFLLRLGSINSKQSLSTTVYGTVFLPWNCIFVLHALSLGSMLL